MLFYPNIYPHKTETKETAITGGYYSTIPLPLATENFSANNSP